MLFSLVEETIEETVESLSNVNVSISIPNTARLKEEQEAKAKALKEMLDCIVLIQSHERSRVLRVKGLDGI